MMKKTILYLSVCCILLGTGCESWLNVSPKSQIKADDLFKNEQGFLSAMSGVYTNMRTNNLYAGNTGLAMVDALGQYYEIGSVQHPYYAIMQFDYEHQSAEGRIDPAWSKFYTEIANCNYILEYVDKKASVLSAGYAEMIKAEMLGVRACLHFDVLRLFGPVPALGLQQPAIPYSTSVSAVPFPQSTVGDVCDKAISDLLTARELLAKDPILAKDYMENTYRTEDYISDDGFMLYRKERMNYYAVTALLARIYLYKGETTKALSFAQEVIESRKFPLLTQMDNDGKPKSLVTAASRKEYIFSLYTNKMEALFDDYFKYTSDQSNLLSIGTTYKQEIFETKKYGNLNDIRERLFDGPGGDGVLYCAKYAYGVDNTRIPMLKIGEMYLIAAECSRNKAYMDTLRVYRGLPVLAADADLDQELNLEYRKEFVCEGQYFYYCKRRNLSQIRQVLMTPEKYRLPFPDAEVEIGNVK